jgi:hypothetical protein
MKLHYTSILPGAGLGGIFGAIARRLIPFAKNYLLPHAAKAARNVTSDLLAGKSSFKESFKTHGLGALKGVGQQFLDQTGSGRRRRKKQTKKLAAVKAKVLKLKVQRKKKKSAKKTSQKVGRVKRRKIKKEKQVGRYLF